MKKYQHIAAQLARQIRAGDYLPGTFLPSLREHALSLNVSKNTLIRAYAVLEDEGSLSPESRKGFRVHHALSQPAISAPAPIALGAAPLSLLSASQTPGSLAFGSANPCVQFPGCRGFYQILASQSQKRRHSDKLGAHYRTTPGLDTLRTQLAKRAGPQVHPDKVMITQGAMEAVTLALRALLEPGDVVAIESPSYYGFLHALEAMNFKVLPLPCDREGVIPEQLEKALNAWPIKALLLTPGGNNPSGSVMPLHRRLSTLRLAQQYQVRIIEDDVFGDLHHSSERVPSLFHLAHQHQLNPDGVIYCNSLSKTLDSDIRLGWLIAGADFERVNYHKYIANLANPGVIQEACARFLQDNRYERHLRQVRRHYKSATRSVLTLIASSWPRIKVTPPQSGYLLWCDIGVSGKQVYDMANAKGINIAPGYLFSPDARADHWIRLNVAVWQQEPAQIQAIHTLGNILRQLRQ